MGCIAALNKKEETVLKNTSIPVDCIIESIREALQRNAGDEATEKILINLGAEILDCSPDALLEILI